MSKGIQRFLDGLIASEVRSRREGRVSRLEAVSSELEHNMREPFDEQANRERNLRAMERGRNRWRECEYGPGENPYERSK